MAEVDPHARTGRTHHMAEARRLATHTPAEWQAKQAEQGHLCRYCKRPVGAGGMKDHYVPVSRGGSDGVDNLVLACWDCNAAKSDMMPEAFTAWAEESGFYDLPQRTTMLDSNGYKLRLSPQTIELMKVPRGKRVAWLARRRAERQSEIREAIEAALEDSE